MLFLGVFKKNIFLNNFVIKGLLKFFIFFFFVKHRKMYILCVINGFFAKIIFFLMDPPPLWKIFKKLFFLKSDKNQLKSLFRGF